MWFFPLFRLPLLASGVIELIRFHGALELPLHLVGQGGIAQPPTPALARPHMPPQFLGHAARGTRQAQEKRRKNPIHDRALAAIQERSHEVIEGALAVLLLTAVALQFAPVGVAATPQKVWTRPRGYGRGRYFPRHIGMLVVPRSGVVEKKS